MKKLKVIPSSPSCRITDTVRPLENCRDNRVARCRLDEIQSISIVHKIHRMGLREELRNFCEKNSRPPVVALISQLNKLFNYAYLPFVPFKSQSTILPLEVIACVPRGSLSGIANESTTMGVRATLFPTRGDRVCSSRLSHWPAAFKTNSWVLVLFGLFCFFS